MKDEGITLIIGYQASGKSSIVGEFTAQGYHRINRDTTGGSLDGQAELAKKAYKDGHHKIVLDNTYITIESRETIIAAAKSLGIPIHCVWLKTSIEDCQLNACLRMMERYGRILGPDELKKSKDPNAFPIVALFGARNRFEGKDKDCKHPGKQTPTVAEGFASVTPREFVRSWGREYVNEAIIFDFDDTLRKSTGPNRWPEKPEHVEILPGRIEKLKALAKNGTKMFGVSNQSAIAKGLPETEAVACFEKTLDLLGIRFHYVYCPHRIPPFNCYCRKPAPAWGAYFIHKHKLNPAKCTFVGDATTDKSFALRCGFKYEHPDTYFQ
jgi:HAD superfamily hydrolase (TIGR01662 family)